MNHYVIICGGRDADDETLEAVDDVIHFLHSFYGGTLRIMHGDARGVDTRAQKVCEFFGITVKAYPADWARGKSAGPERNKKMAQLLIDWMQLGHSGEVIAFKGGTGTEHMAKFASQLGISVTRIPEPGWDEREIVDVGGRVMSDWADGKAREGRRHQRRSDPGRGPEPPEPPGFFD